VCRLRLPDVDSNRNLRQRLPIEPFADDVGTLVVEPHPVYESFVLAQPKQSRSRIPRLLLSGDAADLDVTEPQRCEAARDLSILVEAGRDAHGIGKLVPECLNAQTRIVHGEPAVEVFSHRCGLHRT